MPAKPLTPREAAELSQRMQRAVNLHRRGLLSEAASSYRAVLKRMPGRFDALHLFGVLRLQQGNAVEALALVSAAVAARPHSAEALSSLGAALTALGRHDEALAAYDDAVRIDPGGVDARYNRAVALANLARRQEAVAAYDAVLAISPGHVDALFNRGNLLAVLDRDEEALASYDRALAAAPHHADAFNNRGNVLAKLRRNDEALASFDQALALKPDHANALNNRGNALKRLRRYEEALASFDGALAFKPDHVDALRNRGSVLAELSRDEQALASYDKALAIADNDPALHFGRGYVQLILGKVDEALASHRRALALNPDDPACHTGLIFSLNFDAGATAADHQAERARWDARHARPFAGAIRPHENDPDPDRRLRIGYVSRHFRHQAATYAFGGVLLNHDRERFDVICYSDTEPEDELTARLRAGAAQWRHSLELDDDALARLIRQDRIDILVDLVGHMRGHRLLVFARKPAPIQVTGWGEPTGTGLKTMDYLLADPVLVPAAERALLAERVVDLPSFLGYWTPEPLPEPGALPALARGHVTFGSLNRMAKMLDPVVRCWATLLRALPDARLVLKNHREPARSSHAARIGAVLAHAGVAPERITLLGPSDRAGHFAAYDGIDIALDPFPHGGGMTTLDALWMGVPVVTWAGRTISSRLAAASLAALGLTDFIASDPQAYVERAIAQAEDLDALARLRASLRRRVADSDIGDPTRYARAVEAAYRQMWRRWCAEPGIGGDRQLLRNIVPHPSA